MTDDGALRLDEVTTADTHDLRRRVLRSHMPDASVTAPQDDATGTLHIAARRGGRVVGVVTMFAEATPLRPGVPAMRFRWMAVDPAEQHSGVGTALMAEVQSRASAAGARALWAHGRDSALDFYIRLGFAVAGEAFDDPVSLLPHHLVVLDL